MILTGCPLADLSCLSLVCDAADETPISFLANSVIKSDAVHQFTGHPALLMTVGSLWMHWTGRPVSEVLDMSGHRPDRYLALLKAMEQIDEHSSFVRSFRHWFT